MVKPGFTTLLQNQDLLLEAKKALEEVLWWNLVSQHCCKTRIHCWKQKKQRKRFCGETHFHNIVAKPGFVVESKKSRRLAVLW